MKRLFKPLSNRGVAIETAMFMMVVVFSLCTMLVMFAMISRKQNITSNRDFQEQSRIDQIGEDFCYFIKTSTEPVDLTAFTYSFSDSYYAYPSRVGETNVYKMTLRKIGKYTHVLSLEVEKSGDTIIIKRWSQFDDN